MTKKRTQDPWMSGADYGRSMPPFTVDLIVSDIERSVAFYRAVLDAHVEYSDVDFAALRVRDLAFTLHAAHAFDGHALYQRLAPSGERGSGVMLRMHGIDPDEAERKALAYESRVVQSTGDRGHGWRDVMLADPDGYVWAVGTLLPE